MIDASKIYAPEFAKGESYATYQDQEFHGREIPTLSIKLKNPLTEDEQMDYAYSVGTQLGRGHALAVRDGATPDKIHVCLSAMPCAPCCCLAACPTSSGTLCYTFGRIRQGCLNPQNRARPGLP